jgi:DNA-binding NtrC family response regulator
MNRERDSVLIVEDDGAIAKVLSGLLAQRGLEAVWVPSGEDAVRELDQRPFDVVLSDVRMPGMDGLALLDHVGSRYPELPVVLITAHGSIALAVEAMKRGATDFVQKPFDRDEIGFVIAKALELSRRGRSAPPELATEHVVGGLVGDSAPMREVLATIRKVATSTATVLVRGETGTGKELVARALHEQSQRKSHPFVRVHCGAIPENLLESELFGYERGAFTGATHRKPGRVELAHRGTLFLDEIGDISPAVQVKLLRVLQEREFERIGGTETLRVDVRIVAATHRDLEAMVGQGTFREDLFYRLAVVPITVPPLRDRPGDTARLIRHFSAVFAEKLARPDLRVDDDAVERLASHAWPGNVRELQNLLERLILLMDGTTLRRTDVERELARGSSGIGKEPASSSSSSSSSSASATGKAHGMSLDDQRKGTERDALVRALQQADNNRTRAARLLGVSRRTLYNKLAEYGIA